METNDSSCGKCSTFQTRFTQTESSAAFMASAVGFLSWPVVFCPTFIMVPQDAEIGLLYLIKMFLVVCIYQQLLT